MTLRQSLLNLAKLVADEAARNPEFRQKLEGAFTNAIPSPGRAAPAGESAPQALASEDRNAADTKPYPAVDPVRAKVDLAKDDEKRRGGRRNAALLDPVALAIEGEAILRDRLGGLDIERLHDVVAEYGMDPGKLVMKWRDRDRVIDRIVEVSMTRATKGDAFRKE